MTDTPTDIPADHPTDISAGHSADPLFPVLHGKPMPALRRTFGMRPRILTALSRLAVGECFLVPGKIKPATVRDYAHQWAMTHPITDNPGTLPAFRVAQDESGQWHCWRVA